MKLDLVSINPCPIKQSVKDYQSMFVYNAVVIEFTILTYGRIIGAILQTNTKLVRDYSLCHFKKSCMIINEKLYDKCSLSARCLSMHHH